MNIYYIENDFLKGSPKYVIHTLLDTDNITLSASDTMKLFNGEIVNVDSKSFCTDIEKLKTHVKPLIDNDIAGVQAEIDSLTSKLNIKKAYIFEVK